MHTTYTMEQWRRQQQRVWMFKHSIFEMYTFSCLIVYSFGQFIHIDTLALSTREWTNDDEKRWIHHAARCTFIVHFTCVWWCFVTNYTQHTAYTYGNLFSARIDENDFSATFMPVRCAVYWLAAAMPHQPQMIEKLIVMMKWWIKRERTQKNGRR